MSANNVRPSSRRDVLWNERAQLHAQLGIEPPTATYGIEELEEEVTLARRATELPVADRPTDIDSLPFNAPPEPPHRRPHTTWRNFYAALFFGDQPTLAPYQSMPSEDESSRRRSPALSAVKRACATHDRQRRLHEQRHVLTRRFQHVGGPRAPR